MKLIIAGAGSVGKFVAYNLVDFEPGLELEGFLDDDPSKHGLMIAGYAVLGNMDLLTEYSGKGYALAWGIAFPNVKLQLFQRFGSLYFHYPSFISKHAWVSRAVAIGKGCIIYPGCSINYETQIGDFVVMNMNCAVGHNCTIGDFSSLAPGVNLAGFTTISNGVEMGIGASTRQNAIIGQKSVVGGQSMIVHDVPQHSIVYGNPGKIKK